MKTIQIIALFFLILGCQKKDHHLCDFATESRIVNFNDFHGYTNIEDGIRCAQEMERPIFLLFTAFASVGDTSYEKDLFIASKNRNFIKDNFVPVILYVDNKRKIGNSTIGRLNLTYQIQHYQQNAQPLLAILDQNGKKIIDPIGYQLDSNKYHEFLKNGLQAYQKSLIKPEK